MTQTRESTSLRQPAGPVRRTVAFHDCDGLRLLCGERDAHLRWLEARLGIQVMARGTDVHLQGGADEVATAVDVLQAMFTRARTGDVVDLDLMGRLIDAREMAPSAASSAELRALHMHRPRALIRTPDEPELGAGSRPVLAKTAGQRVYVEAMRDHELVFGVGPAGTGKTYLAMAAAVAAMHRREIKRIVLTRPAVEAGERLGFLPGDLTEKVSPYLRPLYDALRDMVDEEKLSRMMERGQIEVAPLAFMRGRTLANAFVILDEAQNCTIEQMMMLLTRMGEHTRVVVTGDPTQSDLPRGVTRGLEHALGVLQGVSGIGIVRLGLEDVVRHPLVGRILAAYDADRSARQGDGPGRREPRADSPRIDSPRLDAPRTAAAEPRQEGQRSATRRDLPPAFARDDEDQP